MKTKMLGLLAMALLTGPMAANAVGITFLHSARGSGSLNGVGFSDAAFTIIAIGDTTNIAGCGTNCIYLNHTSASIDIQGVGVFGFTIGTRTFMNDALDLVGFSREGQFGSDLLNGPSNAALNGYGLSTSFGPLAGSGQLLQWFDTVTTNGGVLTFVDSTPNVTFQSIVGSVPEPGSLALLGLGLAGLGLSRRRTA